MQLHGYSLRRAEPGRIAILAAPSLGMNYNHPFSSQARFYFHTTPIIPGRSGVVTEVPAQSGATLKKGDVFFRIQPEPSENAVKAKEAALAAAVQATKQLRAGPDAAQTELESPLAERDRAK